MRTHVKPKNKKNRSDTDTRPMQIAEKAIKTTTANLSTNSVYMYVCLYIHKQYLKNLIHRLAALHVVPGM